MSRTLLGTHWRHGVGIGCGRCPRLTGRGWSDKRGWFSAGGTSKLKQTHPEFHPTVDCKCDDTVTCPISTTGSSPTYSHWNIRVFINLVITIVTMVIGINEAKLVYLLGFSYMCTSRVQGSARDLT